MKILLKITKRPQGTFTQWVTIACIDDLNKMITASIQANKATLYREDGDTLQFIKNGGVITDVYNNRQKIVDWVHGAPNPLN